MEVNKICGLMDFNVPTSLHLSTNQLIKPILFVLLKFILHVFHKYSNISNILYIIHLQTATGEVTRPMQELAMNLEVGIEDQSAETI